MLTGNRTQVYVSYAGQRRTCRLCNSYEHIAAQCARRVAPRVPDPVEEVQQTSVVATAKTGTPLWSEEVEKEGEQLGTCVTLPVEDGDLPPKPVEAALGSGQ